VSVRREASRKLASGFSMLPRSFSSARSFTLVPVAPAILSPVLVRAEKLIDPGGHEEDLVD
jgi:hypothetical protein